MVTLITDVALYCRGDVKDMKDKKYPSNELLTKEWFYEIERNEHFQNNVNLFELEKTLLEQLFHLEKEKAQQTLRTILSFIEKRFNHKRVKMTKYYFITLSSIVARRLEKGILTSSNAYAFNVTCFQLIDHKLTDANCSEVADELIEFYSYILSGKIRPVYTHPRLNEIISYINENVEAPLTVEDIAQQFDISTSHLSRIFKEYTGVTLIEYINIRKVEESQYYLRFSSKKISMISDQFHFCNQSYFTRIFKKYTGQTPKKFRASLSSEYFRFSLQEEQQS